MERMNEKSERLEERLKALGSVAVAFSAGVDSTFLLKAAQRALGDRVLAVTVQSSVFPSRELEEAKEFCRRERIRHAVLPFDELRVEGFAENPPDRCYLCKKALFTEIKRFAQENGIFAVAEGSNTDDLGDYRPGMAAIAELGILSPLREAALNKSEIRCLSEAWGLPTWDKPSFACLATRIAYGETITQEKLRRVEMAEQYLQELGFRQERVRVHGTLARIELEEKYIPAFMENGVYQKVHAYFSALGFSYVSLDLGGYRTGNMNKEL